MKKAAIFIACSFVVGATAQTAIIAHKSHSGTATTFLENTGNFGMVAPPTTIQVTKLNDTTVVTTHYRYNKEKVIYRDTLHQHPYYFSTDMTVDSLQKLEPRNEFIGFPQKSVSSHPSAPTNNRPVQDTNQLQHQQKSTIKNTRKSKHGSSFWGIYVLILGAFATLFVHHQTSQINTSEE
jgi:hypothetical protein